jgi:hypothetical protein
MSICDSNIDQEPGWFTKFGPDINAGPKPTVMQSTLVPTGRVFEIAGAAWAGYLNAISRPICPSSGYLTLKFNLMTDARCWDVGQCLEFDERLCIDKVGANGSTQFNYGKGGMFQICDKNGLWLDTGWLAGKFVPNTVYPIAIKYHFDWVRKIYSHISASNGVGQPFMIPSALQNIPMSPLDWTDTCNLQCQLDLAGAGGGYSILCSEMENQWD